MRRGVGVGAIQQRQALAARASAAADSLNADRANHVAEQMVLFRTHLEAFAAKHRHEINRDPEFRRAFAQMAKSIGVDPLSSAKGFWGELLGLGDFYYELSVQAVDVCLATRAQNGGLIALSALRERLQALRRHTGQTVSEDDVRTALRKLDCLGGGYRVLTVGREAFVCSVPAELSTDTTTVLQVAATTAATAASSVRGLGGGSGGTAAAAPVATPPGAVSVSGLVAQLGWKSGRAAAACSRLTVDGLAWVDDQAGQERLFWVPAVWQQQVA